MFMLTIETGNAAFAPPDTGFQVAVLLREVARRLERGDTSGKILDANGNGVGVFELTP